MKIIYQDIGITSEVESLGKKINATVDKILTPEEMLIKVEKGEIPTGVGTASIPNEFIDLGKHLLSFFLDYMASGIAYDLTKKAITESFQRIRSKAKNKYEDFVISDGKDERNFQKNTYFFIPTNLSQEEISISLDKARQIMEIVPDIKKQLQYSGSFRFKYSSGNFVLKEAVLSNELFNQDAKKENRCSLQDMSGCDNEGLMKLITELLGGSSEKTPKIIEVKRKFIANWREITGWIVIAIFAYLFLFRIGEIAMVAGIEYGFNFLLLITIFVLIWLRLNKK